MSEVTDLIRVRLGEIEQQLAVLVPERAKLTKALAGLEDGIRPAQWRTKGTIADHCVRIMQREDAPVSCVVLVTELMELDILTSKNRRTNHTTVSIALRRDERFARILPGLWELKA